MVNQGKSVYFSMRRTALYLALLLRPRAPMTTAPTNYFVTLAHFTVAAFPLKTTNVIPEKENLKSCKPWYFLEVFRYQTFPFLITTSKSHAVEVAD